MKSKLTFAASVLTSTLAVSAFAADMPANEVIPGINNQIVVGEFSGEDGFGHYLVDVLDSEVAISGFAVSSDAPNAAAFRDGWEGIHLSMSQWDAGTELGSGSGLLTTDIGLFSSLFGTGESGANVYFGWESALSDSSDHDQTAPGVWANEPEFVFFGELASQFVAFGGRGNIIDRSLSVPDTTQSVSLLAAGILSMGLISRSRRNR